MVYKEGFLDPKIQIEFNSKHLIMIAPYSFGMLTLFLAIGQREKTPNCDSAT